MTQLLPVYTLHRGTWALIYWHSHWDVNFFLHHKMYFSGSESIALHPPILVNVAHSLKVSIIVDFSSDKWMCSRKYLENISKRQSNNKNILYFIFLLFLVCCSLFCLLFIQLKWKKNWAISIVSLLYYLF